MSVESLTAVLHHSRAKGTAKLVLVGIANHDGDGGAWPTVATLMRYANVDRRNVQRAVDRLVELGELTVLDQQGGTPGQPDELRPNLYRVNVCCPESCDRTPQHRDRRTPRALQLGGRRQRRPVVAPAPRGGRRQRRPGGRRQRRPNRPGNPP